MKDIIRFGDKTSGGGTVQAGSTEMVFSGLGAARQGDPVSCPRPGHGPTVIAEGDPAFCDNGIPVAFHGHRRACGCVLLSSLSDVSVR